MLRLYNRNNNETLKILEKENFSINDKQLLDWCESGVEAGYTQLYHRYSKSVYNSVYRLVTEVSDAEDLTQEIFISLFSDIQKLKSIENLGAWFSRVAINKSISHLRKNKVYFSDVAGANIIDDSEESMEEKQMLDGKIEELQQAIEELPTDTRTIVNLFLFEDMPQEDIAQLLGLSHNTVRSKYHRAKKKIYETLQQTVCNE